MDGACVGGESHVCRQRKYRRHTVNPPCVHGSDEQTSETRRREERSVVRQPAEREYLRRGQAVATKSRGEGARGTDVSLNSDYDLLNIIT